MNNNKYGPIRGSKKEVDQFKDKLNKFSDPFKLANRQKRQFERKEKKLQEQLNNNKESANNYTFDETKLNYYQTIWTYNSKITSPFLLNVINNYSINHIPFERHDSNNVVSAFHEFDRCYRFVNTFIKDSYTSFGFIENPVDYDPIHVSNSVHELLSSSVEYYKILCMLTLRLIKYNKIET